MTLSLPSFFYFDLGDVILHFDREVAFRQMSEVANIPVARVREILEDEKLGTRFELGDISVQQFYHLFCEAAESQPDYNALIEAGNAMFQPNVELIPVIAQLAAANYRLGLLSNTCESHWEYCSNGRYGILRDAFEHHVLSFRVHAMKPDARIYAVAVEMAGLHPQDVFFVDDTSENVEAARQFGLDAVRYTSVPELVQELSRRGVTFNY